MGENPNSRIHKSTLFFISFELISILESYENLDFVNLDSSRSWRTVGELVLSLVSCSIFYKSSTKDTSSENSFNEKIHSDGSLIVLISINIS